MVGFEANGGFLLGNRIERRGRMLEALPARDAVPPMRALLALAKERSVPLSGLAASLPKRFTASDRIKDFPTEHSRTLIANLASSRAEVAALPGDLCGAALSRDEADGLRLSFATGEIVHLRPSGNAPELRCYAGADTETRAYERAKRALSRVQAA